MTRRNTTAYSRREPLPPSARLCVVNGVTSGSIRRNCSATLRAVSAISRGSLQPPRMWRTYAWQTRPAAEVARFSVSSRIAKFLKDHDAASLEKLFAEARAARAKWLNGEYE